MERWQFCQFHGVSGCCFTLFCSVKILLEWFCSKKKPRRVSRIGFFGITTLCQRDSYKSCRTSHQVAGTIRQWCTAFVVFSAKQFLFLGRFFFKQESSMMPKFEGDIPRSFALKPMVVWLDKVWTWLAVASDLFRLTACPLHCHPSVLPWICLGFLLGFCWALFLFGLCATLWTCRSVLIQPLFAQAPPVSRTRLARCLD